MDAGVDLIQIREKDLPARVLEEMTLAAVDLAGQKGATKILVNDRLDVALACGAAGVHLPAAGLSVESVKRVSPPGFLVGVSTHSSSQARAAAQSGADLIVFGPVFPTQSKPGARAVGVKALAEVVKEVRIPVYALGGIAPDNACDVVGTGAAGVAGISVFTEEDSLIRLMKALREGVSLK
jgi:thiamine-phosphate diphosphorylase